MSEIFYMVIRESGPGCEQTKHRHYDVHEGMFEEEEAVKTGYQSAFDEAERLSRKHYGEKFIILKSVDVVWHDPAPIRCDPIPSV